MSELLLDAKQWAKHPWNAFGKKAVSVLRHQDHIILHYVEVSYSGPKCELLNHYERC